MKLAQLMQDTRRIAVDFGGGAVLNVTYRVYGVTPATEELVLSEGLTDGERLVRYLHDIIAEWDLETDDGQPYPLTLEAMREVPKGVLWRIFDAVREDTAANPQSAETSGDG